MKKVLYIKGSTINDVRMFKFYDYFKHHQNEIDYRFWGWDRDNKNDYCEDSCVKYIHKGVFVNLPFSYIVFIFKLYFKLLFARKIEISRIVCVNFEAALPVYWVSKIRKFHYIYEIYDEFSKSYMFPKLIKKYLQNLDKRIISQADYVIHVDSNRIIGPEKDKVIIIENTPNDYWNGKTRSYESIRHRFAITGFFSDARGMEQIYKFAKIHPVIDFLLAGRFTSLDMEKKFRELNNVEYHDYMPQQKLFSLMENCCGIFSLYNPNLEINRYAASNKVYDAMMMGIPVITNKEVINSSFIAKKKYGLVVEYNYGDSWQELSNPSFVEKAKILGINGRKLYMDEYQFGKLVSNRLMPILRKW